MKFEKPSDCSTGRPDSAPRNSLRAARPLRRNFVGAIHSQLLRVLGRAARREHYPSSPHYNPKARDSFQKRVIEVISERRPFAQAETICLRTRQKRTMHRPIIIQRERLGAQQLHHARQQCMLDAQDSGSE